MKFEGLTFGEQELTEEWYAQLKPEDQMNIENFLEEMKDEKTSLYVVGSSVQDFLTNKLLKETQEYNKTPIYNPVITPITINPITIQAIYQAIYFPEHNADQSIQQENTSNQFNNLIEQFNQTRLTFNPRPNPNSGILNITNYLAQLNIRLLFPENSVLDANEPIVEYVEQRSNETFNDPASINTEELRMLRGLFVNNNQRNHEPTILHNILLTMNSMSDEEYQELKILEPILNQPINNVTSAYNPRKALDFLVSEALKGREPVESDIDVVLIPPNTTQINYTSLAKKFEDFKIKYIGEDPYEGFSDIRFTLTPEQGRTLDLLVEKKPDSGSYYNNCLDYESNHDMSERLVLYRGTQAIESMIQSLIDNKDYNKLRELISIPGKTQTSLKETIFKMLVPTLMNYEITPEITHILHQADYDFNKVNEDDKRLLNSSKNPGPLTETNLELAVKLASIYPQVTDNGLGNKLKSLVSAEVWEQFKTLLDDKLDVKLENKEYKIKL